MTLQAVMEPALSALGYELVQVVSGRGGLIQVFIDKPGGITVDDCATASNHLSRLFVVENIPYERLEVSSPGLDRPLLKPADYARFAGREVTVKLRTPLENRRKLTGKLIGLEGGRLLLEVDGRPLDVDLVAVEITRLKPEFA